MSTTRGSSASPVAGHAGRLDFLDGVRGIAAVAVVLEHAFEAWVPGYSRVSLAYLSVGRVGVVAFFLVSGYVIGLTLSKQAIPVFVIRRFWRLFPVYWLVLALTIVVDLPTNPLVDPGVPVFLLNLTMLQGVVALPSILGSAWTLGPELLYYAQTSVSKYLGKLELSVYLGYFWLALYGALSLIGAAIGKELPATTPLMLFFASFGHSIYLRDTKGSRVWIGYLLSAAVVVPLCSIALISSQDEPMEGYGIIGFNLSAAVGFVLFAIFYFRRGARVAPSVLWLGGISYALYLIHLPLIEVLRRMVTFAPWGIPLSMGICVVVAWGVHRLVEVPLIRTGRSLSTKRRPPDSASAR
jgi:peptidoglycan/LPS O-acetylase OafA/YrhL